MRIRGVFALGLLLVLIGLPAFAQQPKVLINEVLYLPDPANSDPNRTSDWVELFNAGTADADLTGWRITAHDGANGVSARRLPSVTLPAGKYLVVRFTSGTNNLDFSGGSGTYFTGDNPATPYWNAGSDEAALYSTAGIVDFIAWSRSDLQYVPGAAHNDAVQAGIWISGTALVSDQIGKTGEMLRSVAPGTSIGRDALSTDTDFPWDFDARGGRDASDITIGRQNLDHYTFVSQPPASGQTPLARQGELQPAATTPKPWTVMLYFNGANNVEKFFWNALVSVELKGGGSTAAVNFVVMFGGKNSQLALLDSSGKVTGYANAGGNFRGLISGIPTGIPSLTVGLQSPAGQVPNLPAQDMGDPDTLSGFIAWARQNYPANHYALILAAHGDSWKSFGPDERFKGSRGDYDNLYMGEFSQALNGSHFDLVAFNSCMMASVEVAYQFQPFTDWLVASEQVMPADPGLDYSGLVGRLQSHPEWNGSQLGTSMVNDFTALYQTGGYSKIYSLALIQESQINNLVPAVDAFAKDLKVGVARFQKHDDPTDNVQVLISKDAQAAFRFFDNNLMDLYDFTKQIQNDPLIDACTKLHAGQLLAVFDSGTAVYYEKHSSAMPNIHGLSVYMPVFRSGGPHLVVDGPGGLEIRETYDLPASRVTDGSTPIAIYAQNHDLLPLKVRDMETGGALSQEEWPSTPTPGLRFVLDTAWSLFLERYYHPVADNHIVGAVAPNGDKIAPFSFAEPSTGACPNLIDVIDAPMNSVVTLSAAGSSDADMPPMAVLFHRNFDPTVPQNLAGLTDQQKASSLIQKYFSAVIGSGQIDSPADIRPPYYIWDLNPQAVDCQACIPPTGVQPGQDAAAKADTFMDEDRVSEPSTEDQKSAAQVSPQVVCNKPLIGTTLMPWDDNHLFSFHDTLPDATYVHPQTATQISILDCYEPPATLVDKTVPFVGVPNDFPPNVAVGDVLTKSFYLFASAGRLLASSLTVATTGGIAVNANGVSIPPAASGTAGPVQVLADPSTGTLQLTVTAMQSGPASLTIHALGTSLTNVYNFTISPQPNPPATDLQVAIPASVPPMSINAGAITAVVKSGSQPLANRWVTFAVNTLNAVSFLGTSANPAFNSNTSIQLQTDANGTAQASLVSSVTSGPFQVTVSTGALSKTVSSSVGGPVSTTPDNIALSGVPLIVSTGVATAITATVNAVLGTIPGASVLFSVVSGKLQIQGSTDGNQSVTIKADSNGAAVMNFMALDPTPVQLQISVVGTQIASTVVFGVVGDVVVTPPPPVPLSAGPASGSGLTQTMTFTFNDPRGYQDLGVVNILINNFLDGRVACYLAYSQPQNVLYLVNDPGTALLSGLVLNGSGSVSNGQCSISGAGSSASGFLHTLTLTLNITFNAAFGGNKVIYVAARHVVENNSGWSPLGVWQVPGAAPAITTAVTGMSPSDGASHSESFTFTFADTKGYQDIGVVNVLVNDYLNGNKACYLAYSQPANALYLVNDAGTALLPALVLNGSGTLSNSQCSISGAGSSASGSVNALTLTLNITFGSSFTGNRIFYLAVRDVNEGNNTGWQSAGARVVE